MNSFKPWARLKFWFAKKFLRLDQIERFIEQTDERYLDAQLWAGIRGISSDQANDELNEGVRLGHFDRCVLYEWDDSPVQFVVPESFVGKKIRLSDIGYIGEDDWREIEIARGRVRTVFVAAEGPE